MTYSHMYFLSNAYLCISAWLYLDYVHIFLVNVNSLPWQTYQHASTVIQSLVEEDINVKFLVQLDKLIRLLETPVFAYLRLQVIYCNIRTASVLLKCR
jgi:hypothetical protein